MHVYVKTISNEVYGINYNDDDNNNDEKTLDYLQNSYMYLLVCYANTTKNTIIKCDCTYCHY